MHQDPPDKHMDICWNHLRMKALFSGWITSVFPVMAANAAGFNSAREQEIDGQN